MSNLVFGMLTAGETDAAICNKLGLEAEELARLKHITGFAKLFADHHYGRTVLTARQMKARADWAAKHPNEPIPDTW
jgi:hypothetical protein